MGFWTGSSSSCVATPIWVEVIEWDDEISKLGVLCEGMATDCVVASTTRVR
jgi:hypothetical protein